MESNWIRIEVSAFRAFWLDTDTGKTLPVVAGGDGSTAVDDPPAINLDDLAKYPKLKEAHEHYAAKRTELKTIFDEAGGMKEPDFTKVKSIAGGPEAVLARVRELNDEVTELAQKRNAEITGVKAVRAMERNDEAQLAEMIGESGDGPLSGFKRREQQKSFGAQLFEAKAHSDLKGQEVELKFEAKTLFETGAGWAVATERTPRVVLDEQRPVQLVSKIPQRNTNISSWSYMEETTFTNNAAETAEGGTKPEAALALTERTAVTRKIAVWIPVTDEQLEDIEGAQEYLNNRLPFMVMQRLDGQLAAGNGTAPNLRGLLNVSGIQTQAKGTDPVPDAIYKAMTKVEVTGQALPNTVVLHPNDWQDIRLLRTADGIYIWGNPSEKGPETIWGLDVAKVQAMTENTGIVFDSQFTELAWRKGMTVKISDQHDTFFITNKQAVRAEIRVAFTVFRPSAVCSVTSI